MTLSLQFCFVSHSTFRSVKIAEERHSTEVDNGSSWFFLCASRTEISFTSLTFYVRLKESVADESYCLFLLLRSSPFKPLNTARAMQMKRIEETGIESSCP